MAALKNSVAVITGGSSGIGLAVAEAFGKAGAKAVVISGRNEARVKTALEKLKASGSSTTFDGKSADATSWTDNQALFKHTFDTYGQVDYVFANATAIGDGAPEQLDLTSEAEPSIDTESLILKAIKYTIHAASPYLIKSPPRDKAIILTSSEAAFSGYDISVGYAVGKASTNQIVYSYRDSLQAHGIRINAFAPGYVPTALTQGAANLGVIQDWAWIPIEDAVEAHVGLASDTNKTGFVRRLRDSATGPFDHQVEHRKDVKLATWRPILAKFQATRADAK